MNCSIIYKMDDGDIPSPKQIVEAFNLLCEFCPELRTEGSDQLKAFNRVLSNREFDWDDAHMLLGYGQAVAKCAQERYTLPQWQSAPWRDSIMQSAANLFSVINAFWILVERCEREKWASKPA